MNSKGFALTETLVVVVFLVTIFTFIYVSILPLIGKYEDVINHEKDIDIVYKLFYVRKMIMSDANKSSVTSGTVNNITCNNLSDSVFCTKLMEQMELVQSGTNKYVLIYADSINAVNLNAIKTISKEVGEYAEKYKNDINNRVLFLLDTRLHTIAHLYYDDSL